MPSSNPQGGSAIGWCRPRCPLSCGVKPGWTSGVDEGLELGVDINRARSAGTSSNAPAEPVRLRSAAGPSPASSDSRRPMELSCRENGASLSGSRSVATSCPGGPSSPSPPPSPPSFPSRGPGWCAARGIELRRLALANHVAEPALLVNATNLLMQVSEVFLDEFSPQGLREDRSSTR